MLIKHYVVSALLWEKKERREGKKRERESEKSNKEMRMREKITKMMGRRFAPLMMMRMM